jgi:putative transposase
MPALVEVLRRQRKGQIGRIWNVDETDIKVAGRWCYVHRAIDSSGALVDVLFREQRDMKAAQAFFRSAQVVTGVTPKRGTTDGRDSYPCAIHTELGKDVHHRTSRYRNNRLEQDHRGRKGRYRPMRGSSAPGRRPRSIAAMTSCVTTSGPEPATTNMFQPPAADYNSSTAPSPY